MRQSLSQRITTNFYAWEHIGRGWYVFDKPVELEPDFVPFIPVDSAWTGIDESLRPSIFERVTDFLIGSSKREEQAESELPSETLNAFPLATEEAMESFSISFPKGEKPFKSIDIERFMTMLSNTKSHLCFEIVAWDNLIRLQFVCRASDTAYVEAQVRAYFPSVIIQTGTSYIYNILDENKALAVLDLGLAEEFMRPLAVTDRFESDPLTGLYGILDNLKGDEQAVIQIMLKGTINPWAVCIMESVTDGSGESAFANASEMPKLAQEKVSAPLFAASIRIVTQDSSFEKAKVLAFTLANTFSQCTQSAANRLITLNSSYYQAEDHFVDILYRRTRRTGMLLNAKELATFVHYPVSISAKQLETDIRKTKRAPNIAWGHEFCLGTNRHRDFEGIVTLSAEQRLKHMHVIGATGTGKSTLLQSCIVQDIHLGNGVAVLDPHGDLIESILPYIPKERIQDVIIIDPADSEFPVGFNILTAHSDIEKEILASDLVSVFRRLSTSFGDQMHSVLANAIIAFLESSTGGTLMDLRRFLIEKDFRNDFLKTVADPNVVYYWQKEYPLLKSSSIGSILTRLDSFLRPKLIRNMVAQKKSLDFEDIMDSKKIVLIKLAEGLVGKENSYLLGTFFVSKVYQAAMARQAKSKNERTSFFLYIDEFQNFATPSMSSILSGTRKYGLGCILAHQDMSQLQSQDSELATAVVSNAGTRVCFRIGDIDAKRFADGFSSFETQDIQNLEVGQAIVRIERPEYDFTMSTLVLSEIEEIRAYTERETIIERSRQQYGTARSDIEQSINYSEAKAGSNDRIISFERVEETEPEPIQPEKAVEVAESTTKEQLIRRKEQTEHRYLQTFIKKMAEERGYKASIEEPTPDGKGRVDVALERNGKRIACEIGMTTTAEWELHNIEKCLNAGYDHVIAIAKGKSMINVMQSKIRSSIEITLQEKIRVMEASELVSILDSETNKEMSAEMRIKGYRVHVEYSAISNEEFNAKKNLITQTIMNFLKSK